MTTNQAVPASATTAYATTHEIDGTGRATTTAGRRPIHADAAALPATRIATVAASSATVAGRSVG